MNRTIGRRRPESGQTKKQLRFCDVDCRLMVRKHHGVFLLTTVTCLQ